MKLKLAVINKQIQTSQIIFKSKYKKELTIKYNNNKFYKSNENNSEVKIKVKRDFNKQ